MDDNILQQFQTEGKLTTTLPRLDIFKHKDQICRSKGVLHVKPNDGKIEMEVDLSAAMLRRYFSASRSGNGALYSDCDYWHIRGEIEDGQQILIRKVLPIKLRLGSHSSLLFNTDKFTIFKQNNKAIKQCTTTVLVPGKDDFRRKRLFQHDKQMSFTVNESKVEVEDVAGKFVKFNILSAPSRIMEQKRIVESLVLSVSFLLGKHLFPQAVLFRNKLREQVEIRYSPFVSKQPYEFTPLWWEMPRYFENARTLLQQMIQFYIRQPPAIQKSFKYSINIIHDTARTIDCAVEALLLTVVVELLARILCDKNPQLEPAHISNQDGQALTKFVKANINKYPTIEINRMSGLISSMNNPQVGRILSNLRKALLPKASEPGTVDVNDFGPIYKHDIDAWKNIRNKIQHGDIVNWPKNSEGSTANKVAAGNKVASLINKLIFCLIGYAGGYVEYGLPNYPDRVFTALPFKHNNGICT